MFKFGLSFIPLFVVLLLGCGSSHTKNSIPEAYSNQVELKPAADLENTVESTVYIDSVQVYESDDRLSLLVLGAFPDGCTSIGEADFQTRADTISLSLSTWRNPDQACTQALVAFSFIYRKIPEPVLREARVVNINGTDYSLTQ
ncbi:hypothetical protein ACG2F4_00070 [Halalkalibaculum sp. DA3122]